MVEAIPPAIPLSMDRLAGQLCGKTSLFQPADTISDDE